MTISSPELKVPIHLVSMGRYLPQTIRTNANLEAETGLSAAVMTRLLGVQERRVCNLELGETASFMGAEAIKDACVNGGLETSDIDLIINASATCERILPDGAVLIQKHLGLSESGVPCFSVHATCLSFLVGMNVVASLLQSGAYRNVALVSSENASSHFFDNQDMHTYPLFGSMAVAAIYRLPAPSDSISAITRFEMETFGEHVDLTTLKIGSNVPLEELTPKDRTFQMEGAAVLKVVHEHMFRFLEKVQPGLSRGEMGDICQILPHQASARGLKALEQLFGPDKIMVETFPRFGNTISCGIPNALYEAIKAGRLKRGEAALLIGSGAGVSFAALKFIY